MLAANKITEKISKKYKQWTVTVDMTGITYVSLSIYRDTRVTQVSATSRY